MKKLITLIALVVCTASFAQRDRAKMRETIKAEKIAFITEKLSLTEDEAIKFWPIYNKHETTRRQIKNKYFRPIKKKMRNNADISEVEANKILEEILFAEEKMHQAKIELVENLKGNISAKKIIKLKPIEDDFNRKLLERLKKYRQKNREN